MQGHCRPGAASGAAGRCAGLANAWPAKVQRLARAEGDGPREVVARLPWGGSGVGYAAQQAQGEPWTLRTGRKVWLSVPESAVVLAVAD